MANQREWQLRRAAIGGCQQGCLAPAEFFTALCVPCGIKKRLLVRRLGGHSATRKGRPWRGSEEKLG